MARAALLLTLAFLAGCSSVREVCLTVRDARASQGVAGVRVRAISLDSGTVPLPLNDDTVDEILALGAERTAVTTDAQGEARLRLRGRVAHLLELLPPPLGPTAPAPDETPPPARFVLSSDLRTLRAVDDAQPVNPYTVEVRP